MNRFGIVIVTYQSASVIAGCLQACLSVSRGSSKIVVVDNASTDNTVEVVKRFPEVLLTVNSQNRGFAAACNQGAAAVSAPFLLFLNPDTVPQTSFEPLADACELPGVAGATGRLVDESGAFQQGFGARRLPSPTALAFEILGLNRLWPGNPVNRSYRYRGFNPDRPQDVEQPPGALLCIRRDAWQACQGMDERFYPLWFEDVDLCRRLRNQGGRIRYCPEVIVQHEGAHSAGSIGDETRPVYWYGSLLKYAAKHFSRPAVALVSSAVIASSLLRLVVFSLAAGRRGTVSAYRRVLDLGWYHLLSAFRHDGCRLPGQPLADPAAAICSVTTTTEG